MLKSLSLTTKVDFQKKKFKDLLNKLKDIRIKMKRSEGKSKLKMDLKVIAQMLSIQSVMKNSREKFLIRKRKMFLKKFQRSNHGFQIIRTLKPKIMKVSKRRLKRCIIQLCKKHTKVQAQETVDKNTLINPRTTKVKQVQKLIKLIEIFYESIF